MTEGNPFFVGEIVRLLVREGGLDASGGDVARRVCAARRACARRSAGA